MSRISELLSKAVSCQKNGNYVMARELYKDILKTYPQNRDILLNLGIVCRLSGMYSDAIGYLKKVYPLYPESVQVVSELGMALIQGGFPEEGLGFVKSEIEKCSKSAELHYLLGNLYRFIGNFIDAEVSFRNALTIKPDFLEAQFNLSSSLLENQKFEEAIAHLEMIIKNHPDFIMAYLSLSRVLIDLKRPETAVLRLMEVLKFNAVSVPVYVNLATAQIQLKLYDDALENLHHALTIEPGSAEILNGIGNIYMLKNEFVKAKEWYHQVLIVKPDNAETHFNLGLIMREWDRIDEAVICYKNSLKFDPERIQTMINLGECYQARGEIEESEVLFGNVLVNDPVNRLAWDNLLLSMNYNVQYAPKKLYDAHVKWGRMFKPVKLTYLNSKDTAKKLRIGYLSPDFRHHPSAAFLEPIINNHNHENFTTYCYSQTRQPDSFTERFKKGCDYWRDIGNISDSDCAEIVQADKIDILVDCAGHMDGNRLGVFALKPAPVQITGIGYPNTTGLECVDFRLTDIITDPPGETSVHTEQLLYLNNGFCCYNPPDQAPEISELPVQKNGFITFGSLHTPARLNSDVIACWAEILKFVEGSRMLIFRNTLSTEIINRLKGQFENFGIENERVEYCSTIPSGGYLNIYSRIDILLDTFPWSGHTTACEALWMGVPVITLRGNRYAGRMVSSVLTRISKMDYIAADKSNYRDIAIQKSSDISALASDRQNLRNAMKDSLLCDGKKYTMELESRYRDVWSKWCSESAQ